MAAFRYQAITAGGRLVTGIHEATSQAAVIQHLRSLGNCPVSAKPANAHPLRHLLSVRKRPSLRALTRATQELASLLTAGVELDRALGILTNLQGIESLKNPFVSVRARIRDGSSLADSLSHDDRFPPFYVSAVRAGEFGGALETALTRLAEYMARSMAVRESITSALVYPCILVATACCSVVFILVFVLPQFEPLFAEAGRKLPFSTRVVIAAGHALTRYWWLIALSLGGFVVWIRASLKRPVSRALLHRWLLRLPLFGSLVIAVQLERFFRNLGTLLGNGVPLPTGIAIASGTVTNEGIAASLREIASKLREGERLSDRLARTSIFPRGTFDLIRIGEETGKLDVMLIRQADLDAQHLKQTVDRLLALLVPALTIVLGIIVAGLIASMIVALLSVNDLAL